MTTRRKAPSALLLAPLAAGAAILVSGCPAQQSGSNTASTTGGSPAATTAAAADGKGLVIAWAEWAPAKSMETLTKDFTQETGIPVTVQQIPWSNFETEVKKTWTAQDPSFDMVIGDSQWLGKAATSGHYVELTDWAKGNVPVADITPAALKAYGEYPEGSGKLYALPAMSDATVFAYRKDLFDDPANQKAFQAKYGHPLAPPKTWDEFKHVAEFFTDAKKGMAGAALYYGKDYDGVTMGFDQVLWSFGGKLSDGKKVEGVINSPEAVKALEFYTSLKPFTPKGSETYYFSECLRDFQQGKVAMAQSWFAFLPDLTDKAKNPHADKTGYFMVPAGPAGQYISLGGQGISISAYSKKQDDAKKFLAWFEKEDTQKKWVSLGGLTANSKVAATDEFKKATPYNAVFAESVPHLKDFYNNPEYSDLLNVSQDLLNQAVAGGIPPKQALDEIAKKQQAIMDEAGSGG
jgi:multiple sugar transport system substrate-binding protein